jgi:hypothetical protein
VLADIKDDLVVIAGGNKKEHEYIIPRPVVSHCDEKQVFIDITANSLGELKYE